MTHHRLEAIVCALAALLILSIASTPFYVRTYPADVPESDVEALARSVRDYDLLTTKQQVQAIETGRVAFDCAGKHYVVEGIPRIWLNHFYE